MTDLTGAGGCALTAVAVMLSLWAAIWPARLNAATAFEVQDVRVDVTAETAAAARERALADVEQKAFRRLFERLTLRADHDRMPALGRNKVSALVMDIEVAEEKTSSVRYIGRINVRFKADEVRRLLVDHNLPFAETPSKPVLVLPVYQEAGAIALFDEPNPWRAAWAAHPPSDGLVPFVLPLGDLQDILAVGAEQALKGDAQRLAAIASRYGARDALVAHGVLRVGATGPELEVFATRYGTAMQENTIVNSYAAEKGEGTDALLARAVADVMRRVEDNWKRDNLLQYGQSSVLAVKVPVAVLADWLDVRRRLASVAVVKRVDLILLSRAEVRINLHYLGDLEQLRLALYQADLALAEEGTEWQLGRAGATRASQ